VCCMFYSHINYRYIIGDQRMMSFGFSGSPPPFWQIKYDDDDDDDDDDDNDVNRQTDKQTDRQTQKRQ